MSPWALNEKEHYMYYVYIIRSIDIQSKTYIGFTQSLKKRLKTHNDGGSAYTSRFRPWELVWYCAFPDKYQALAFESYLKSHSGKAFRNKRLITW